MKLKQIVLAMVSACALSIGAHAQVQTVKPAQIPVADFFRTPALITPELSPDGRYLAAGVGAANGRVQLVIVDLQNPSATKTVARFSDADIVNFDWINSERLVFSIRDLKSVGRRIAPGLWAVNKDGSEFRQLIKVDLDSYGDAGKAQADRRLSPKWSMHSLPRDGSTDVIVQAAEFSANGDVDAVTLSRLDTRSGRAQNLIEGAPAHARDWVLDREGQPAAVTSYHDGRYASYLREGKGWKLWQEGDQLSNSATQPVWVEPDGDLLAVSRNGTDYAGLYQVNRKDPALPKKALLLLAGYDFDGALVYDEQAKRMLGVHFETDAQGTAWSDVTMQSAQQEVDALLPNTVNRLDCRHCLSVPVALVRAISDRSPPSYYLYHRDTKKLESLGASRPWIQTSQMAQRDMLSFQARDKRQIPVLVTQPQGKAAASRPTVVLVHGGPFVRGTHWGWEAEAQFLASRGYVVIEPEFRGSTNYGFEHFKAGWKQWGLAMQDDVADAARWAVQQGWADAKRICIAGASYGGYATLMGLIKDPDLYQCGFEWVGVSDIQLMYDINWSDSGEAQKRYGMPRLIGDPVQDAQQLKATSPLEQAARLKRPLLMAYGGEDRRVPIKHGTAFRDAVQKTNSDVEWVVYPNEGHGWMELATNVDFWSRVEKFLDRHIGPSSVKLQSAQTPGQ